MSNIDFSVATCLFGHSIVGVRQWSWCHLIPRAKDTDGNRQVFTLVMWPADKNHRKHSLEEKFKWQVKTNTQSRIQVWLSIDLTPCPMQHKVDRWILHTNMLSHVDVSFMGLSLDSDKHWGMECCHCGHCHCKTPSKQSRINETCRSHKANWSFRGMTSNYLQTCTALVTGLLLCLAGCRFIHKTFLQGRRYLDQRVLDASNPLDLGKNSSRYNNTGFHLVFW